MISCIGFVGLLSILLYFIPFIMQLSSIRFSEHEGGSGEAGKRRSDEGRVALNKGTHVLTIFSPVSLTTFIRIKQDEMFDGEVSSITSLAVPISIATSLFFRRFLQFSFSTS